MPHFTDQTGQIVTINKLPRRIISLVPSQTELLYDLGLTNEVMGITKFCVHPGEWFHTKTKVGGTKQIKPGIIHQLNPDLIIANKEENVKEQIEEMAKYYPVWISDVSDLTSALDMIEEIGKLVGKEKNAGELINKIQSGFNALGDTETRLRTCYLIWQKPYMTVGGDTFIHSMLEQTGLQNIFSNKTRYPEIIIEDLKAAGCELLLLPSEPFPFKQKHAEELRLLVPGIKIRLVDGEIFSWYGSRLQYAPDYFNKLYKEISSAC